mmetsp:Transcript_34374/g.75771  ORF Transcript_34374/g.75771 Transcript_34374/m.75771 type:complete len:206 (-) Transcript_34374:1797-2414(-)
MQHTKCGTVIFMCAIITLKSVRSWFTTLRCLLFPPATELRLPTSLLGGEGRSATATSEDKISATGAVTMGASEDRISLREQLSSSAAVCGRLSRFFSMNLSVAYTTNPAKCEMQNMSPARCAKPALNLELESRSLYNWEAKRLSVALGILHWSSRILKTPMDMRSRDSWLSGKAMSSKGMPSRLYSSSSSLNMWWKHNSCNASLT